MMELMSTPPAKRTAGEPSQRDADVEGCYFKSKDVDVNGEKKKPGLNSPQVKHPSVTIVGGRRSALGGHDYVKLERSPTTSPFRSLAMEEEQCAEPEVEASSGLTIVKNENGSPVAKIKEIKSMKNSKIHKIIIVPAGADVEKATAQAMDNITAELNQRAADRLAQGHTPEKETVVEITRICTPPSEGYFSRESMQKKRAASALGCRTSFSNDQSLVSTTRNIPSPIPSKSIPVLSKTRNTPTKTGSHRQPASPAVRCLLPETKKATTGHNILQFVPAPGQRDDAVQQQVSTTIHHNAAKQQTASHKLLPNTAAKFKMIDMSCPAPAKASDGFKGSLNSSLTNMQWLQGKSSSERSHHRDVKVIASEEQINQIAAECGRKKRPPFSYMHLIQMAISSKEERKMTLKEIYKWVEDKFPYYKYAAKQGWKNSIRHNLSLYDIFVREKSNIPGQTGSSYWTLKSDVELQIVCRPSTRCVSTESEDSSPTSSPMLPVLNHRQHQPASSSPVIMIPGCTPGSTSVAGSTSHRETTAKLRKGPALLLPKPPPTQTFALIPIQSGIPVIPTQPIMVSDWQTINNAVTTTGKTETGDSKSASATLKRNRTTSETAGPLRKQVKIAPKMSSLQDGQAVVPSSQGSLSSSQDSGISSLSSSTILSVDTTAELGNQLSQMNFDSGIDLKSFSSDASSTNIEVTSSLELPKETVQSGLPKPKMFRQKRPRKEKQKVRHDLSFSSGGSASSDSKLKTPPHMRKDSTPKSDQATSMATEENLDDIIAHLGMSPTIKQLLRTPEKAKHKTSMYTSTPSSDTMDSPSWISPIHGLTPLSDHKLGSEIFTPKMSTSTPCGSDLDVSPAFRDLGASPTFRGIYVSPKFMHSAEKSPRLGSLRGFGLPGFTPLKTSAGMEAMPMLSFKSESFGKEMADFHLDNIMDDGDMPINLSFSALS